MFYPYLINLILFQFLNLHLRSVVFFHCWSQQELFHLAGIFNNQQIFSQYVNLNDSMHLQNICYRYLRHRRSKQAIFLDMNCKQTENIIKQANHTHFFNEHFHWLIFDHNANISRFYGIFKNISLAVNADIDFIVPYQHLLRSRSANQDLLPNKNRLRIATNQSSFLVFDVYNNGYPLGGKLNMTSNYELECNDTICWISQYLTDLHKRSTYGNRETLRDITMRVAVLVTKCDLNSPPEIINDFLMEEQNFHIDPLPRFGFRVLKLLIDSLQTNVSYEYHDHWTDSDYIGGAVGALVNQTVDLTSSPFFLTPGRLQFLSPLAATGDFRSVCMFRTPRNSGIHGRVFLEPLSKKVWIIFIIILIISAVMLKLAFSMEYYEDKLVRSVTYIPSLLTTCLISFGSACSQSSFLIPRSIAGRLAFISLLIVTFIIYNYYTSVVVSTLLGSPIKSKIKTLGQLADSDLDVGLEPLPYTYTYLNFSTLPYVKRFVKNKILSKKNFQSLWYSAQDGILKMRNKPGFVFIFETSAGYQLIEQLYEPHEICDLNEILFRSDTLLFFQMHRNSSYKEIIRLKIIRILETGVHSRHRRQWMRTHINCLNSNLVIKVGMEYAAPLVFMLLFGFGVALVLLLLEVLWKHWELKKRGI